MARKFQELRDKMTLEQRSRADTLAKEILDEQASAKGGGLVCPSCRESHEAE